VTTLFPEGEANNNSEILHFTMKMKLTTVLNSALYPEDETHTSSEILHFTLKMTGKSVGFQDCCECHLQGKL
jgi:hypothetical protein